MSFCWVGRNAQLEGTLLFFLMEHVYNIINLYRNKCFREEDFPARHLANTK